MEKAKKKKIAIIVSLVSVILIAAVLGTFFAIKSKNNNKKDNPAENVNSTIDVTDRLFEAHNAIINENVSVDFNGTYKFKTVSSLIFNSELNGEQIIKICQTQGTADPNGLQMSLLDSKKSEVENNNETLVFHKLADNNGSYTKLYNNNQVVEFGKYYGNNDLSEVRVYNDNTSEYIAKYDISLTSIKEPDISVGTASDINENNYLYIYKKVYSAQNENLVLFTITYVYELVPVTPTIPDEELTPALPKV